MPAANAPSSGLWKRAGLTLLETLIALALVAVILAIMLPALSSARQSSHRDQCANHLKQVGEAFDLWVQEHDKQFPFVPVQPGWHYGGMRLSRIDGTAYPDFERPLTAYLGLTRTRDHQSVCVCCPADRGIAADAQGAGTGGRTVFESFGTSYRANAPLLDVRLSGLSSEARGIKRSEITTDPSRLLICGDAVWYEIAESTGRDANWHGERGEGNMLFLDGSVRFLTVRPKEIAGPVVYDPDLTGTQQRMSAPAATTLSEPTAPTASPFAPEG